MQTIDIRFGRRGAFLLRWIRLTIVIPAFNEARAVGGVVERLTAVRDSIGSSCDDGSSDETGQGGWGSQVIRQRNLGYGPR